MREYILHLTNDDECRIFGSRLAHGSFPDVLLHGPQCLRRGSNVEGEERRGGAHE